MNFSMKFFADFDPIYRWNEVAQDMTIISLFGRLFVCSMQPTFITFIIIFSNIGEYEKHRVELLHITKANKKNKGKSNKKKHNLCCHGRLFSVNFLNMYLEILNIFGNRFWFSYNNK